MIILPVILIGCQALSLMVAVAIFLPIIISTCLFGILFIFALNFSKSVTPKLHFDRIKFSKRDLEFLLDINTLPLEDKETKLSQLELYQEDLSLICIKIQQYQNKNFPEKIEEESLTKLEKSVLSLVKDGIEAVIECQKGPGLVLGICNEIKTFFIPKWLGGSSKKPLCKYLYDLSKLLTEYPCSDFLILLLKHRELTHEIADHILSLASSMEEHADLCKKTLGSLNLWFYGWFLETDTIKRIDAYDPEILINNPKLKEYLIQGNFVEFILSLQTEEMQAKIKSVLKTEQKPIVSALENYTYFQGLNSVEYLKNSPKLRIFMDALSLKMAFCLDLRSPSDWRFPLSVARHYKELIDLYEFALKEYSNILENLFILIELFQSNTKYQTFIRGLLEKAMPIKQWLVLFRPIVSAVFQVGVVRRKELSVLAAHLGIEYGALLNAIRSGQALEALLPYLFNGASSTEDKQPSP
ncbi:hypothetical protein CPE1_0482 [Chlamydia pecorum PV3056/3]|nr:hypothetical protein [Chlamydia pecorum]AGW37978.1 hypothetical protein CPE1_0482 [Chlamydia pecorum PV3056/3]